MNKQIARAWATERTIKAHRLRVMVKMQVRTLAELVSLAERVGVLSAERTPTSPSSALLSCAGSGTRWSRARSCTRAPVLTPLGAPRATVVTALVPSRTPILTPLHANCLGLSIGNRQNRGAAARPNAAASPMRESAFRREIISALVIMASLPDWMNRSRQCIRAGQIALIHINGRARKATLVGSPLLSGIVVIE